MRSKVDRMIRGESTRLRRGPWFLAALLLALASALVPALSPSGAITPVRMQGSAFDPTNGVETLRGRDPNAVFSAATRQEAKAPPAIGPAPAILAVSPRELAEGAQVHPAFLSSLIPTAPTMRPSMRSPAQPRAPPVQIA